jgi:nitrogen regulatory protein P-II 1
MKEIKAFVHAHRIADVIAALEATGYFKSGGALGCYNLSVFEGKGIAQDMSAQERHYSMALAEEAFDEFKLELLCEDDRVEELVAIILKAGRTDQQQSGWIYVTDVTRAIPIPGGG